MFDRRHRDKHRERLETDIAALGLQVVWSESHDLAQQTVGEQAGRLARLAIVGEAKLRATEIAMYRFDLNGSRMLFVQSYLGGVALPSYLHARLPGNLGVPVMPYRKLLGFGWHAQDAPDVAASLDGMKGVKAAVKQLAWKKHSQEGHVQLDWVLQVRALGDGTSELIFQIGSPAMDLYDTGLGTCLAVREALRPALPEQPMAKQGLYFPAPYEHVYEDVLHEA